MSMFAGVPDQDALRGRWKWFVGLGILMVILGFAALGNVVSATLVTTVVVGFLLVVGGAFQIIGAFTGTRGLGWRILWALIGLLYIVVGFDLVADPLSGAITLTWVVAFMLVAGGTMRLVGAILDRPQHWVWIVVIGIINILLGIWLFTNIPFSAPVIGFFVGFELVFAGFTWIFVGWAARDLPAGPTVPAT
jgi:uncharacterized membrane protein HdeD (DUF308 family)